MLFVCHSQTTNQRREGRVQEKPAIMDPSASHPGAATTNTIATSSTNTAKEQ
jgi:hypothetical protein